MADLIFRYGAMNCGKTAQLLQVAHNYEEKGLKTLIIKPSIDTKGEDEIVSRLGISRRVNILLKPDEEITHKLSFDFNISCILIDEAQFLSKFQVYELWNIAHQYNIPVICYGLKINFKAELFEGSKTIIEIADKLEQLPTICRCGRPATFNARYIDNKFTTKGEEVAIDGIDASYESLCPDCYMKERKKEKTFILKKY